jgi:hypothetical protein
MSLPNRHQNAYHAKLGRMQLVGVGAVVFASEGLQILL